MKMIKLVPCGWYIPRFYWFRLPGILYYDFDSPARIYIVDIIYRQTASIRAMRQALWDTGND